MRSWQKREKILIKNPFQWSLYFCYFAFFFLLTYFMTSLIPSAHLLRTVVYAYRTSTFSDRAIWVVKDGKSYTYHNSLETNLQFKFFVFTLYFVLLNVICFLFYFISNYLLRSNQYFVPSADMKLGCFLCSNTVLPLNEAITLLNQPSRLHSRRLKSAKACNGSQSGQEIFPPALLRSLAQKFPVLVLIC